MDYIVTDAHSPRFLFIEAPTSALAAMQACRCWSRERLPYTAFRIGLGDKHSVYGRNDSDQELQFLGCYEVREKKRIRRG
jgi:hypothetical protein